MDDPTDDPTARRVLVVSAGMGAGHHGAADELVRRLRAAGAVAHRVDVLDLGRPGQGRRLRRTYAALLRWCPLGYDAVMRAWARWPALGERLTARGTRGFEEGLAREVAVRRPDLVVSTYNLASQALGRMRGDGRLPVPVTTVVTDPGAHPYWVGAGVDAHLAPLPAAARALAAVGARGVGVAAPLVAPAGGAGSGRAPVDRARARARLGLPADGPVALVGGGSWGSGAVLVTARLLAAGGVVPVVLCGRDERLRRRASRRLAPGGGRALGWTDDVASWRCAADVLVDGAGGLSCWEALAAGLPVLTHRPLHGHGRLNARALEAAGLAPWVRRGADLAGAVRAAAAAGPPPAAAAVFAAPGVDQLVLRRLAGRPPGPRLLRPAPAPDRVA